MFRVVFAADAGHCVAAMGLQQAYLWEAKGVTICLGVGGEAAAAKT